MGKQEREAKARAKKAKQAKARARKAKATATEACPPQASKEKEKGKLSEEEAVSEEPAIAKKKPNNALKKEKGGREKPKDPTTLSPHELKEETFLLKYPFIKVHKGMDDYQPLRMDHGALSAFQQHLAPSIVEYHHLYQMDGEELTTRPAHAALMYEVGRLADYLAHMKTEDDEDREGVKIWVSLAEDDDNGDSDAEEENSTEGQEDGASKGSSREGIQLKHESFSAGSRPDFLVRGYDKGYLKRHQLQRFHPDALCTFLVVEPKNSKLPKVWTQGPGGGFQAGSYSAIEALKNIKKGRRKPIDFQGWSAHHWSYGELRVDGVVKVIDGQVLEVGTHSARPDLQEVFNVRQTELQDYMLDLNTSYADGDYLVGDLYVSHEIFDFPRPERLTSPSYGSLKFLESILVMCLGKKILAWKEDDVERLLDAVTAGAKEIKDNSSLSKEVYERVRQPKRLRR